MIDSDIKTDNGEVHLTAEAGSIEQNGGRTTASKLWANSLSGITANTDLEEVVEARVNEEGDILFSEKDSIILTYLKTTDGSISVEAYGDMSVTSVQTLGSSDDNDISLLTYAVGANTANLDFEYVNAGDDGDVTLDIQGALVQSGSGPIIADHLEVTIAGALNLKTQVKSVGLKTTAQGDVIINEADGVELTDVQVLNGSLTVNAAKDLAGDIIASQVELLTNLDENDISLTTILGGDILLGYIRAGIYAGTEAEADVLRLEALNAALRSFDPDVLPAEITTTVNGRTVFVDLTLRQVESLTSGTFDSVQELLRNKLLASQKYSEEEALAEAKRTLQLEMTFTSLGDVNLQAAGSISELLPEDDVDLIADQVTSQSGNGIYGLEAALNSLLADVLLSGSGPIQVDEFDSMAELSPGLEIVEARTQDGSIFIKSQNNLEVNLVEAAGSGANVSLGSQQGSVVINDRDSVIAVKAESGLLVNSGQDITIMGDIAAPDRLEFHAGTVFNMPGKPIGFEANTVKIEVGSSITIDGVIRAVELVQLISNKGNINITGSGSIEGRPDQDLKEVSIIARGNKILAGDLAGYYQYQDQGQSYYQKKATPGEGPVYELIEGELVEVAHHEYLHLSPVLQRVYELVKDEQTGMDKFKVKDQDDKVYYYRKFEDGNYEFYRWHDFETGFYAFTGFNLNIEIPAIETFYKTDKELGKGDIYYDDKTTIVTDLEQGNIENLAPLYTKLDRQQTEIKNLIDTLEPETRESLAGNIFIEAALAAPLLRNRIGSEMVATVSSTPGHASKVEFDVTDDQATDLWRFSISAAGSVVGPIDVSSAMDGLSLAEVLNSDSGFSDAGLTASWSADVLTVTYGGIAPVPLANATDLVQLHAQNELVGVGLNIEVTGTAGVVDISTGAGLTLDTTIKANKRVALASTGYVSMAGDETGGNVTINGTIQGYDRSLQEVVLEAKNDLNLNANVNASNLIRFRAGGTLGGSEFKTSDMNLEAAGAEGIIDISVGGDVTFNGSLQANKRIALGSTSGNVTVQGTLKGVGYGEPVEEVVLDAFGDLDLQTIIDATHLIQLHAGGKLIGADLDFAVEDTIDISLGKDIVIDGTLRADGKIVLTSTSGDVTISEGSLSGKNHDFVEQVFLHASNNIRLDTMVHAYERIDLKAGGSLFNTTGDDLIAQGANGTIAIELGGDLTLASDLQAPEAIYLNCGGYLTVNGQLSGLSDGEVGTAELKAGNDVVINDAILAGNRLDVTAGIGEDRIGGISVNGAGSLLAQSGDIMLTAGQQEGDITLSGPDLTADNVITLQAAGGRITHTGGLITADTLIAESLSGILFGTEAGMEAATNVDKVTARVLGAGDLSLYEQGAITLTELIALNGSIGVKAGGQITVIDVDCSATDDGNNAISLTSTGASIEVGVVRAGEENDVTLDAQGGAITQDGDEAADVLADVLIADAAGEIHLDTEVGSVDASTSAAGAFVLNEIDDIILTEADTSDGAITVTAQGTIAAIRLQSQFDSDDNDITLTAKENGAIEAGHISAGTLGDVSLNAATIHDLTGKIVADELAAFSAGAITLDTRVRSLDAETRIPGDLIVTETDRIILRHLKTSDGIITVTAGGQITAVDVDCATTDDGSNAINLESTGTGADIEVQLIKAGIRNDVTLDVQTGAITQDGDEAADVLADVLIANAPNGIDLDTTVRNVTASTNATGTSAAGAIVLDETDEIILTEVETSDGAITVTAEGQITATEVNSSATDNGSNGISLTSMEAGIEVGLVNAGVLNHANLDAKAGAITQDGDETADVLANVLTADAAGEINLDTEVGSVDASTSAAGAIVLDELDEIDGITLVALSTSNGAITVTSEGQIIATDVDSSVSDNGSNGISLTSTGAGIEVGVVKAGKKNDVTLDAQAGAITQDGDEAADVLADMLTADAVGEINLDTEVGSADASTSAAGAIVLDETDDLTLTEVETSDGAITVTAYGKMTARWLQSLTDSDDNDITLIAEEEGAIEAGHISAGMLGNVSLTAGTIRDLQGKIVADNLEAFSAGAMALDTSVKSLHAVTSATGILTVTETDDIELSDIQSFDGAITVTAGRAITATSVQSLRSSKLNLILLTANSGAMNVSYIDAGAGGDVMLNAGSSIDATVTSHQLKAQAAGGMNLTTAVAGLDIENTESGNILINESDAVAVFHAAQAGAGHIRIEAGGTLAVENGGEGNVIFTSGAGDIFLEAVGAPSDVLIKGGIQSVNGQIQVMADNDVIFQAAGNITSTAGSVIIMADANGDANGRGGKLTMQAGMLINAGSGTIVLSADEDVTVGRLLTTNATNGAVMLTSMNGAIRDAGDRGGEDIAAEGRLVIDAATGVGRGNAVETAVGSMDIGNTLSGCISIRETDAVLIQDLANHAAMDGKAATGGISLVAGGTITIGGSGVETRDGDILLKADGVTADVMVEAGIITSGTGNVSIWAGNCAIFTADGDITVNGSGKVAVTADQGGIAMTDGAVTTTDSGAIIYHSNEEVSLSLLHSTSGAIRVSAGGAVSENTELETENLVTSGTVKLAADKGIGAAGIWDIDTSIGALEATNRSSGGIYIQESDTLIIGGSGVRTLGGNGKIDVHVDAGSLTIHGTVSAHGNGTVEITAAGDLIVLLLKSNGSNVSLKTEPGSGADIILGLIDASAFAGSSRGQVLLNSDAAIVHCGDLLLPAGVKKEVKADALTVFAGSHVAIFTDINSVDLQITGTGPGNVRIDDVSNIILDRIETANGAVSVTAAGTVIARYVESLTDRTENDVELISMAGDVLVDLVQVGSTHGHVHIEAANGIRELIPEDDHADIIGYSAYLEATEAISGIEFDVVVLGIVAYDLLLIYEGDIDLNFDIQGIAEVTATGNITVTHLTVKGEWINLHAGGNIRVREICHAEDALPGEGPNTIELVTDRGDILIESLGVDVGAGGSITVIAGNDISIDYLSAGTEGTVILSASGSILEWADNAEKGDDAVDMVAGDASFTAGDSIGFGAGADRALETTLMGLEHAVGAGDGTILFNESDDLVLGDVTAGWIAISSGGQIIMTDTGLISGESLDVSCVSGVDLKTNVRETTAELTGSGDLTIHEADAINLFDMSTAGGVVNITSGDTLTISGALICEGEIALTTPTSSVNIQGKVKGTEVAIHAGTLDLSGTVTSDGDMDLTLTEGGAMISGAIAAGGVVVSSASGALGISGLIETGGRIDFAGTSLDLSSGGSLNAGGDVSVAVAGALMIDGAIISDGIVILSGTSLDLSGAVTSKGDLSLTLTEGEAVISGAIAAGGKIVLSARGALEISGFIEAGALVDLKGGSLDLVSGGSFYAGSDVAAAVTGTLIIDGSIISLAKVTLDGASLDLSGRIASESDMVVDATSIVISGEIRSRETMLLDAAGCVTLTDASYLDAESDVRIRSGDILSLAGQLSALGQAIIEVADDLVIDNTARVSVSGLVDTDCKSMVVAGRLISTKSDVDINATDGGVIFSGTLDACGNLNLKANGGLVISGTAKAGDEFLLYGANLDISGLLHGGADTIVDVFETVTITGTVVAWGSVTITSGKDTVISGNVHAATGTLSIDTQGTLVISGTCASGLAMVLDAAGRVDMTETSLFDAGGNFSVSSGGTLMLLGRLSSGRRVMIKPAADLIINGTVSATGRVDIEAASLDLCGELASKNSEIMINLKEATATISGTLEAYGNVSLYVAENTTITGTIRAGRSIVQGQAGSGLGGLLDEESDIEINAGGSITVGATGEIEATGYLTLEVRTAALPDTGGDDFLEISGKLTSDNFMRLEAPGRITQTDTSSATAGRDITLLSGDILTISGQLKSEKGWAVLTGSLGIVIDGEVDTAIYVDIDGASLALSGSLNAGGGVDINLAAAGATISGAIYAGGGVIVSAAGALTISGSMEAKGFIGLDSTSLDVGGLVDSEYRAAVNAADVVTITGSINAFGDLTITAGTDLLLFGEAKTNPEKGKVNFTAGNLIFMESMVPVKSKDLVATANYGVKLQTEVCNFEVHVSSAGIIEIHEQDSITLAKVTAANGSIKITAGGAITAAHVVSNQGAPQNKINLISSGSDVLLGYVDAGKALGVLNVDASGRIQEMGGAGNDPDIDLVAHTVTLKAGETVGDSDIANLHLEMDIASKLLVDIQGTLKGAFVANIPDGEVIVIADQGINLDAGAGSSIMTDRLEIEAGAEATLSGISVNQVEAVLDKAGKLDLTIAETSFVTLEDIRTEDGSILIIAGGAMEVGEITAGGLSEVILMATGGGISNDDDPETNITAEHLTATAAGSITLDTNVANLDVSTNAPGDITISEVGDIELSYVVCLDGKISVEAGGTIWAIWVISQKDTNENGIILTAGGDLLPAYLNAGDPGEVTLASAGRIDQSKFHLAETGLAVLIADQLSVSAVGSVDIWTDVNTLKLETYGPGDVFIVENSAIILDRIVTFDGAIEIRAGGELNTLAGTVIESLTDTDDNNITLATANGGSMTIGELIAADPNDADGVMLGDVNLISAGDLTADVTADELVLNVAGNIVLQGNINLLRSAGGGDLSVKETGAVVLDDVSAADGSITVLAGGTITATKVRSLTDSQGNDVSLTATSGDVLIDYIEAGMAYGRILVISSGDIREVDAYDPDVDVAGHHADISAGGEFGSTSNPELNLEMDLTVFSLFGKDLIYDIVGDIELNLIVSGIVDVTATGTITVIHMESEAGEIHLTADGDIRIDYLSVTETGTAALNAAGSIYEVDDYDPDIDLVAGNAYLNAGEYISGNTDRNLDLETELGTVHAQTGSQASLYIDEATGIIVDFALAPGGVINLQAGEDITIAGSVSTSGLEGSITLDADGQIYMTGRDPLTTPILSLTAGQGVFLLTQIDTLNAVLSSGIMEIQETDALVLQEVTNVSGSIRIMAGDTVIAERVEIQTDLPGNNTGIITTGGDILVDYVAVGPENGQLSLCSAGEIRELDPFDADIDLQGALGILYAEGKIDKGLDRSFKPLDPPGKKKHRCKKGHHGRKEALYEFERGEKLKLKHVPGDVELFFSLEDKVDVSATGDINVTYLASNGHDIDLKSKYGNIGVDHLETGPDKGDVELKAAGSILLSGQMYSGDSGHILAGRDISIWAGDDVRIFGIVIAGSDSAAPKTKQCRRHHKSPDIIIDAGSGVFIRGTISSQDDVKIWSDESIFIDAAITAGDDIEIDTCGELTTTAFAPLRAGDDIRIFAGGTITLGAEVTAGDDIRIDSGAELYIQAAIDSTDDVRIKADDGIFIDAPITAADDIKVESGGSLMTAAGDALTAGDDIELKANGLLSIGAALTAGDDVRLSSCTDVRITSDLRAEDDVKIRSRGDIEVAGDIEAFHRIRLSARENLTLLSQASLTGLDDGKARFVYLHAGDELNLDGFINAERIVVC